MNQKELIQLMELWEKTDPFIYKSNIKAISEKKFKDARNIESEFKISYNTARSF